MKRFIFLASLLLIINGCKLSELVFDKGNSVAVHVWEMQLAPNKTIEDYLKYMADAFIPAFNKEFKGDVLMSVGKWRAGNDENCICIMYVFKSSEIQEKYWSKFGVASELWKIGLKNIWDLVLERNKIGIYRDKYFTEWIIQ